jgi:hypothetical protein
VTDFSIRNVVLIIVTQPVVYVTIPAVTGCGKIRDSGVEPHEKDHAGAARRTVQNLHDASENGTGFPGPQTPNYAEFHQLRC